MPCYVRVLRVLAEIRDGFSDLAGSREAGSITEAIDLNHIKEQAEAGLYSWDSCTALVAAIVAVVQRVQAPKRDNETKAKWADMRKRLLEAAREEQPRVFCNALEFLLDRVNAMRIDAANARLRLIAPVIKDHGVDYERGKFQDKLAEGALTLERTEAWIRKTMHSEVARDRIDLEALVDGTAASFVRVHSAAMLSLVAAPERVAKDAVPETLLYDVHRIATLQREFQYQVAATTMLVTAGHIVGPKGKDKVEAVASKLFADEAMLDIDAEVVVAEMEKALEPERFDTLRTALLQCASPTDAVHRLLYVLLVAFFCKEAGLTNSRAGRTGCPRYGTVLCARARRRPTSRRRPPR